MAKRTQKAGATGRFGARYGVSVRRNAGMALAKKSAKYT
ncbi:MAG: 50S ribosomal protein L37ae, partial [Euryarchaeota archaeon]|nr:50S ribosomal protein L37ae [Euryarchaeota archaeon]